MGAKNLCPIIDDQSNSEVSIQFLREKGKTSPVCQKIYDMVEERLSLGLPTYVYWNQQRVDFEVLSSPKTVSK